MSSLLSPFSEKHPTDSQCLSECGLVGPVTRYSVDLFSDLSGGHGNLGVGKPRGLVSFAMRN